GNVDTSFTIGTGAIAPPGFDQVRAVRVDSQGRIILGGGFTNFDGTASGGIVRLLSSGAIDPTFQPGAGFEIRPNGLAIVYTILLTEQGNILVGGSFTHFNGAPATNLVMLTDSGAIAAGFSPQLPGGDTVFALASQPGKGILMSRYSSTNRS